MAGSGENSEERLPVSRNYTRHGHVNGGTTTAEYRTWQSIVRRCHNPRQATFADYGAKGVAVCSRWRNSAAAFLADMGPRPSSKHSIDRIDGAKGYQPSNCRWATPHEQQNNRSCNVRITALGITMTVAQWSRATGIKYSTIYARVTRFGWSPERAVGWSVPPLA